MTIRVTNATFESVNVGDYATLDDAYDAAVAAGLEIASNEVVAGAASAIVEVAVDLVGRTDARRGSVAVATARLRGGGPV